jgi:hypothetical protein
MTPSHRTSPIQIRIPLRRATPVEYPASGTVVQPQARASAEGHRCRHVSIIVVVIVVIAHCHHCRCSRRVVAVSSSHVVARFCRTLSSCIFIACRYRHAFSSHVAIVVHFHRMSLSSWPSLSSRRPQTAPALGVCKSVPIIRTPELLTLTVQVAKKSYTTLLICLARSLVVIVVGSRWRRCTGRREPVHERRQRHCHHGRK